MRPPLNETPHQNDIPIIAHGYSMAPNYGKQEHRSVVLCCTALRIGPPPECNRSETGQHLCTLIDDVCVECVDDLEKMLEVQRFKTGQHPSTQI